MTRIVINVCFGGFGLSRAATKRLAELQGRPCYFFEHRTGHRYVSVREDGPEPFAWVAFDVPNPNEVIPSTDSWSSMSAEDRCAANAAYDKHHIDDFCEDRSNPLLVQVVEELGDRAAGSCGELKVVDIPDDVKWEIKEYDGSEWVAEAHRLVEAATEAVHAHDRSMEKLSPHLATKMRQMVEALAAFAKAVEAQP